MVKIDYKILVLLNILMFFYSFDGVLSKMATQADVGTWYFILCYGGILFILFIYAVLWQQIIKHLDLSMAYANKATTIVWGGIWGHVFFKESFSFHKIIGMIIVIAGVVLYAFAGEEMND